MKYIYKKIPWDWIHFVQIGSLGLLALAIYGQGILDAVSISHYMAMTGAYFGLLISLGWEHK